MFNLHSAGVGTIKLTNQGTPMTPNLVRVNLRPFAYYLTPRTNSRTEYGDYAHLIMRLDDANRILREAQDQDPEGDWVKVRSGDYIQGWFITNKHGVAI